MAKTKSKATKTAQMPPRWHNVIAGMVLGNMTFESAMADSGYSEAYYKSDGHQIKKDPRFSKALQQQLAKKRAKVEVTKALVQGNALIILDNCMDGTVVSDMQGALKANEQLGKTCWAFGDKLAVGNQELPPATPEDRARWLADYANMSQAISDVTNAIAIE